MKAKTIFIVAVLLFATTVNNVSAQKTITGFEAPESVIKSGNKIFVSNMGGTQADPMALDGNGFISVLSDDGNILQKKFNKAVLNGPKGLAVIGNTLYTADINRVVGFNTTSGEQVFELDFPDAKMLNDLCVVDDKDLVVSESVGGNVYVINVAAKKIEPIGNVPGANGVTYDKKTKQLYACGMGSQMGGTGKLFVQALGNKTGFTELANSPVGVFDGLEMIDEDHLLVSDWHGADSAKGKFTVYDLKTHASKNYTIDIGPADVYFDAASKTFYLPQLVKNTLLIGNLNSLKQE